LKNTRALAPKRMNLPKKETPPYFGLSRTAYLQTLANRWGDFNVSWNFTHENGEIGFTKKRSVLKLWQEHFDHPLDSRLEKVQHREAMPCEHFIEIDEKDWFVAVKKKNRTIRMCEMFALPYAIYKSRKGYHISVLDSWHRIGKEKFISVVGSDMMMKSKKATWSMEWTQHWKQKGFVIKLIECSPNYARTLLGGDLLD